MAKRTDFTIKRNNNFILSDNNRQVLSLLYRPLIGSKASDIYNIFYEMTKTTPVYTGPVVLLIDMMSDYYLSDSELNNGIKTLSTYKLIKVTSTTSFELFPPYSTSEFINSPLYSNLVNNTSNAQYEYLSDIFSLEEKKPDMKAESLDSLSYKVIKNKKAPFTFNDFKEYSKEADYDIKNEDEEFFTSLAKVYSLSLDDVMVILNESSDEHNNYDRDSILEGAYKKFELKLKKKEKKENNKELNDSDYINFFIEMKPEEFLEKEFGSPNVPDADLNIIKRLREDFLMKDELITILLAYSLATKNMTIRPYSFFEKIAKNWAKLKIETAEDAFYHITDMYKKTGSEKPKETTEEWFENYWENIKKEAGK